MSKSTKDCLLWTLNSGIQRMATIQPMMQHENSLSHTTGPPKVISLASQSPERSSQSSSLWPHSHPTGPPKVITLAPQSPDRSSQSHHFGLTVARQVLQKSFLQPDSHRSLFRNQQLGLDTSPTRTPVPDDPPKKTTRPQKNLRIHNQTPRRVYSTSCPHIKDNECLTCFAPRHLRNN